MRIITPKEAKNPQIVWHEINFCIYADPALITWFMHLLFHVYLASLGKVTLQFVCFVS